MLVELQNSLLMTSVLDHFPGALFSAQDAQEKTMTNDLSLIASLHNPPLTPLTSDKIFIRHCKLAGDAVDAHGGCFRTADLPKLLELSNGAPALIGHNRQSAAVARFFGGTIFSIGENQYIAPKFYWPREHSKANDLRVLIDSGILNEASVAFQFEKAECSICSQDIRFCSHIPFEKYDGKLCFYYYHNILRVLEGSFVYRGAEPNTGFMKNLQSLPESIRIDGVEYTAKPKPENSNETT